VGLGRLMIWSWRRGYYLGTKSTMWRYSTVLSRRLLKGEEGDGKMRPQRGECTIDCDQTGQTPTFTRSTPS
jgi:hypothetical protein